MRTCSVTVEFIQFLEQRLPQDVGSKSP